MMSDLEALTQIAPNASGANFDDPANRDNAAINENDPNLDGESVPNLSAIENILTLDTTITDDIQSWMEDVENCGIDCGIEYLAQIDKLPRHQTAMGYSLSMNRVLKGILKANPAPPGAKSLEKEKTFTAMKAHKKAEFFSAIEDSFSSPEASAVGLRNTLIAGLLKPFKEHMNKPGNAGPNRGIRGNGGAARGDSDINRVLLIVSTLIHPDAIPILETIFTKVATEERPAALDVIGGTKAAKLVLYGKLVELSETLKTAGEFDLSRLQAEYCGEEAAQALIGLDPSKATIPNAEFFQKEHVAYMNRFDVLIGNLDASGGNRTGITRRDHCYQCFCGGSGRSKDMSIFIAFLYFDGGDTRFISRKLPPGIGSGSMTDTNPPNGSREKTKTPQKGVTITIEKPTIDPEEVAASKKLKTAQEELVRERTITERASRLNVAMSTQAYNNFPPEAQAQISVAYLKTLLGSDYTPPPTQDTPNQITTPSHHTRNMYHS